MGHVDSGCGSAGTRPVCHQVTPLRHTPSSAKLPTRAIVASSPSCSASSRSPLAQPAGISELTEARGGGSGRIRGRIYPKPAESPTTTLLLEQRQGLGRVVGVVTVGVVVRLMRAL